MGNNVELWSLSDQPLLRLDERICLRNRNLKQVGDSLRGCQREPMQIRRQFIVQGLLWVHAIV